MTNSVELQLQTAMYFHDNCNYSSYKGCHIYTVFYLYPNPPVQAPTQGSYPPNCATFQLPLVSPFAEPNLEDPISLLASNYSITFHVSEECQACRLKGGQCPLDSQEFLCLKKRAGRSELALILGTVKNGFFLCFTFILVSHLPVLRSCASSCPSSIDCGSLGPIKFPFTSTTHPSCGLFPVTCDGGVPQVALGSEGITYQVSGLSDDTIEVNDPALKSLIIFTGCDFSSYINLPNTLSVSFTISPSVTFFQCLTSSPELENQTDKYFIGNYTRFRGCQGYTVYYSYPNNQVPTPGNYPLNCEFFQLPVVSSVEGRNLSNPFSLLTSDFSIGFHMSEACLACHANGGQCSHARDFQCLNNRGGIGISISL
ncbi:hypothetical protein Vadar_015798 [Vaccinium darrowii]|uniref:Uncharacterized protein n=1 Tax=Vaccinium darrowii TaxID=229202 RepID=A0ACB7XHT2_9ERIC|nr:hypothetical protein Vadar_015798 [Vaccinium darrowii]